MSNILTGILIGLLAGGAGVFLYFQFMAKSALAAAKTEAEQIRATVETKKLVKKSTGDILGTITISIGVAQFGRGEAIESVVRRADACLYGAKHHGRNLVINQNDTRMAALEPSAA